MSPQHISHTFFVGFTAWLHKGHSKAYLLIYIYIYIDVSLIRAAVLTMLVEAKIDGF